MELYKITEDTPYEKLLSIIVSGCKFKYYSYDHKKAVEELHSNKEWEFESKYLGKNPNSWDMPEKLKNKHKVERIGKLRSIDFNPSGKAWRFRIGAKRAKVYYLRDFGVNVFPIQTNP